MERREKQSGNTAELGGLKSKLGSVEGAALPTVPSNIQTGTKGIVHLKSGSLIGLIGQALIWVVGLPIFIWLQRAMPNSASNLGPGINTIPGWNIPDVFYASMLALTAGFVLGVASFVLFYAGFRAVKEAAPDFRVSSALLFVGLLGYSLMALASGLFVGAMASAITSAGPGAASAGNAALNMNAVWAGVGLISTGGILGFLGTIALTLESVRAGHLYSDSTLKVGATLTILPFGAVVGQALLLLGYSKDETKVRAGCASPGWTRGGALPPQGSSALSSPTLPLLRHAKKPHHRPNEEDADAIL